MSFNGLDPRRSRIRFEQEVLDDSREGRDFLDAATLAADHGPPEEHPFWIYFWDFPPCSYAHVTGDFRSVTMLSDFYSDRQWHAHPLYVESFAGADAEHVMPCGGARRRRQGRPADLLPGGGIGLR